jgi:hypothetical protein
MIVATCELPSGSAIEREMREHASYTDSYRVALRSGATGVVDLFFAIFGHHPAWLKAVLLVRHRIGTWFGLDGAAVPDILHPTRQGHSYRVGDTIGAWPIYSISDDELVAGRDNSHLDFRLSLMKDSRGPQPCAIVSTVCRTHNRFGRAYLRLVVPFHRWGVQRLLLRAHRAGRL